MASYLCLGPWFHLTPQILNNKYVPLFAKEIEKLNQEKQ